MAQAEAPRSSRRKQPSPRVSSTGLPASAPISLQQGEPQRKGRKRTAGAILAEEASALPQPAAAKRLRKPAGSYRELAGEGMKINGQLPKRATMAPSQPKCPGRRYLKAKKRSAATSAAAATAMEFEAEIADAKGAALSLVSLSSSRQGGLGGSVSSTGQALEYASDAHNSPTTSGDESTPVRAGASSQDDSWMSNETAADVLLLFSAGATYLAAPEDF